MNQKGKITFGQLIFLLLLLYAVFAGIKHFSTVFEKSQIEKEVFDTIGVARGGTFSEEEGYNAIRNILSKKSIIFDEKDEGAIKVTLNQETGRIEFYYSYEIETDFIFFKKREFIEVEDEMDR